MLDIAIFSAVSLILSLISMPVIIKICQLKGVYDYHDERKIHSGNISRLGGIGIFLSFTIVSIVFSIYSKNFNLSYSIPLLLASFLIFIFGVIDDVYNLPAVLKLIVQIVASIIVVLSGFKITNLFGWILPLPLSIFFSICWIVFVVNAYNLIDGLDGLCGNLAFITLISHGVLCFVTRSTQDSFCFILAASVLGFLCFNWPPAKIFMGDGGSQSLGFLIATLPLFEVNRTFEGNKFLIMLLLSSIPILDVVASIWRRLREHRHVMSPDSAHLHHKLLNIGFSKNAALYTITIMQLLIAISVLASVLVIEASSVLLLLVTFIFVVSFFAIVHYSNRAVIKMQKK